MTSKGRSSATIGKIQRLLQSHQWILQWPSQPVYPPALAIVRPCKHFGSTAFAPFNTNVAERGRSMVFDS